MDTQYKLSDVSTKNIYNGKYKTVYNVNLYTVYLNYIN